MPPSNKVSKLGKLPSRRDTTTVRLAFHKMGYNAIVDWIETIKLMDDQLRSLPKGTKNNPLRFTIMKEKLARIEKMMEFVYPKIHGTDIVLNDLLDAEERMKDVPDTINAVSKQSTEELMKTLNIESISNDEANSTDEEEDR